LDLQLNNGGVWLELEGGETPELEVLLGRLEADATAGLYPVVAVVTRNLLDLVFARLTAPTIQIVIEPGGGGACCDDDTSWLAGAQGQPARRTARIHRDGTADKLSVAAVLRGRR
jgi:hypothetical protein